MDTVPPPRLLFWETTRACNLSCRHCRAVPIEAPEPDELTTAEAADLIAQAARLGVRIFVFSGGEPLLRPDLVPLLEEARGHDLEVAVATNGTILTREVADTFRHAGVARVSVSLDGAHAATHDEFRGLAGAFDRALEGISALRHAGQPFQVNTTVTRQNLGELTDMVELALSLGACALHLFLLVPVGCGAEIPEEGRITPQEYEDILSWVAEEMARARLELRATCAPHLQRVLLQKKVATRGRGCLAGTGIVFVGSCGDVKPCGYMPLVVGNVRQSDLATIWHGSEDLESLRDTGRLAGRCGRCPYRKRCGGCRARALAMTGDLLGDEPMCQWGRENVEEN